MTSPEKSTSRRGLLAVFGLTGAATATLALLPAQVPIGSTDTQADPKPMPTRGGGYTLSEHVKRYYKTTLL
jgi:hypothetical protein